MLISAFLFSVVSPVLLVHHGRHPKHVNIVNYNIKQT